MSVRRTTAAIGAGFLLAAMLACNAPAAETNIIFGLDRKFDGPAAPFLLALDNGDYKAEGLNVSIAAGANALEPIKRIAAGTLDMALADINALIKFRDAEPKSAVKAVFMLYNRPAYAVIGRRSRGVSAPKDLEGKKLGATAGGIVFAQIPIFAKTNGIDMSKVTIETVGLPVRDPLLAAGQVDAITGLSYASFIDLTDKGVPRDDIVLLMMADYGVKLYGKAIIVNPKFAEIHADAVRGFLRAFLKGLKQTVKAPAGAIEGVLQRADGARKELELKRLKMVIRENILTPEVRANGYGAIDVARFAAAIDQLSIAHKFKSAKPKPDDIFDASFLPPADAREVN
jgi:NitT/TauT family transport system substrate-binding protein